jgi:hypothetical protein
MLNGYQGLIRTNTVYLEYELKTISKRPAKYADKDSSVRVAERLLRNVR